MTESGKKALHAVGFHQVNRIRISNQGRRKASCAAIAVTLWLRSVQFDKQIDVEYSIVQR